MTTKTVNGEMVYVYTTLELQNMVEFIICHGRGVTDWEGKFLKDMQRKDRFSERQAEIIVRIHAEKS